MKKLFTLLLMAFMALSLNVKASTELNWSSFSAYENQGTWDSSSKTFTATANWGGAQIWYNSDMSSYDVLVLEIKSATGKFQINIESKPSSGDNTKVTEEILPSDESQFLIMTLDGNKSSLQKVEFKLNEESTEKSIVFGNAYFMTTAESTNYPLKKSLSLSNLDRGWNSSYDSSNKQISFEGEWKGRGWGIEKTLTAYNKVVIDFAEALPYAIRVMVEYSGTYSGDNHYAAYTDVEANATSVMVPLNTADNFNTSINQIYIQPKSSPGDNKVTLKRAYIANNHYYLLDESVTPEFIITKYHHAGSTDTEQTRTISGSATIDLYRTFKSGWNTICLPFATTAEEIALGADVYTYTNCDANNVTLTKVDGGVMTAGSPYMLYVTGAAPSTPITFTDVTVSSFSAGTAGTYNGLTFSGNYNASMSMNGNYGLVNNESESYIYKGKDGSTLPAFSAYFLGTKQLTRGFSIITDDGTTKINTIEKIEDGDGEIYNLMGVRTSAPRKGIYIKNGKKYIVK